MIKILNLKLVIMWEYQNVRIFSQKVNNHTGEKNFLL